jgi:hypothetical protein
MEPAKGRWPGWPCFVGRDFRGDLCSWRCVQADGHDTRKAAGAKPCRMNTCTKMPGGWGRHAATWFFSGSRATGPNQSDLAL